MLLSLSDFDAMPDRAMFLESILWEQSVKSKIDAQQEQWFCQYLSSCFRTFRTDKDPKTEQIRRDWQSSVEVINMLVGNLREGGEGNNKGGNSGYGLSAFLILPALAGVNFFFILRC